MCSFGVDMDDKDDVYYVVQVRRFWSVIRKRKWEDFVFLFFVVWSWSCF